MTSDHHHLGPTSTTSATRLSACPTDEEAENEKLWQDFQNCAQTVTRLYRDNSWKQMQTSAAATTQLYKTAVEASRRGFEKGVAAGRTMLAKEIMAKLSSNGKVDINSLLEHLYCNMGLRTEETHGYKQPLDADALHGLVLFQQALSAPTLTASPNRSDLNNFLASQVQRRKRQRSPSSPTHLYKKSKRC